MPGQVDFTEEQYAPARKSYAPSSELIGWLIARGVVENEEQAKMLLIAVIALSFIIAGIALFALTGGGLETTVTDEELRRINESMNLK